MESAQGLVEIHFLEVSKNNCGGEERETKNLKLLLPTIRLEDSKPNESIVLSYVRRNTRKKLNIYKMK